MSGTARLSLVAACVCVLSLGAGVVFTVASTFVLTALVVCIVAALTAWVSVFVVHRNYDNDRSISFAWWSAAVAVLPTLTEIAQRIWHFHSLIP